MDGIELQKWAIRLGLFLSQSWNGDIHYLAVQGQEPNLKFKSLANVRQYLQKYEAKKN